MTSSAHIADPRRLVTLGSNRWAFKPELGLSKPKGRGQWKWLVVVDVYAQPEFFPAAQGVNRNQSCRSRVI